MAKIILRTKVADGGKFALSETEIYHKGSN